MAQPRRRERSRTSGTAPPGTPVRPRRDPGPGSGSPRGTRVRDDGPMTRPAGDPAARRGADRDRDHRRGGPDGTAGRPLLAVVRGQRERLRPQLRRVHPRTSASPSGRACSSRWSGSWCPSRSAAWSRSRASAARPRPWCSAGRRSASTGRRSPGVVSWLVSIGWETFLAILAVLATATVFERLGWSSGTGTQVVATGRRRRAHRRGQRGRLPRDHAAAVGADLDHRRGDRSRTSS